nr:hypothetical protein CFP56_77410 [Quercus suber]
MAFSKVGTTTRLLLAPPPYIVNGAVEGLTLVKLAATDLEPPALESTALAALVLEPLAIYITCCSNPYTSSP